MTTTAPIILFCYKRLHSTILTIDLLSSNDLAGDSILYVFSDGPKNQDDEKEVASIRKFLKKARGFKKIHIIESNVNKGLSNSIIDGVTSIINEYGRVIVLEDDLLSSRNFLTFINQALEFYEHNPKVLSIAGFTKYIKGLESNSVYFMRRASSWGWGTWKSKWNEVDWEVKGYDQFSKDKAARRAFNQMGSDMTRTLDRQMRGKINSWAIRWCFHQFKNELLTVYPAVSKIENIGFNEAATHTKGRFNRFRTIRDQSNNLRFSFPEKAIMDNEIVKQFTRPFTISSRIKYKLLNSLPKFY
jgi:hypothetical protein